MKPEIANPSHPLHQHYRPELDDYPDEEAVIEQRWKETGGVDADGNAWLTPRMERNAIKTAQALADAQEAHEWNIGAMDRNHP